jgi:uncharacterized HAD superfamily protein
MVKKLILTDVDGCILDWNEGFISYMAERGYPELEEKRNSYLVTERHACSAEMISNYMNEYASSETIARLKPIRDSVEVIKRLHTKGYEFIAITSLGSDQKSFKYRWKNLHDLYGNAFERLICLPSGSGKTEALHEFVGKADIWVEDHVGNATDGTEKGFTTFLIDQPYNSFFTHDEIIRVKSWKEIESWIESH